MDPFESLQIPPPPLRGPSPSFIPNCLFLFPAPGSASGAAVADRETLRGTLLTGQSEACALALRVKRAILLSVRFPAPFQPILSVSSLSLMHFEPKTYGTMPFLSPKSGTWPVWRCILVGSPILGYNLRTPPWGRSPCLRPRAAGSRGSASLLSLRPSQMRAGRYLRSQHTVLSRKVVGDHS